MNQPTQFPVHVKTIISHIRRWCSRIWRTVSAEIDLTTPSRTNRRAISAQSHCDNDRPRSSGRSQAIFTTCIATSAGEGRLAALAGAVAQPFQAILQELRDPLPHVLLRHVDQPRWTRRRSMKGSVFVLLDSSAPRVSAEIA